MNENQMIDHFPLQSDLKKLKLNIQKFVSTLVFPLAFLVKPAEKYFDKLIQNHELLVIIGFVAIIALTILVEYLSRKYYYNNFGIGIIRSFGNKSQWYSFDELTDLKINQKGVRHSKSASTSITLIFYSGKVKVDTATFIKAGVEDLADIVQKKKPESYTTDPKEKGLAAQLRDSLQEQLIHKMSQTPDKKKRGKSLFDG